MKNHLVLTCALPAILLSSICLAEQTSPLQVAAKESCQEHILYTPHLSMRDYPRRGRWRVAYARVVITYKLDGSGKASDLEVVASNPKGLFDKTTRLQLERTQFKPGVSVDSCTYIRIYESVKRSGL